LISSIQNTLHYFFQSYDAESEEFDIPPNRSRSELGYAKVFRKNITILHNAKARKHSLEYLIWYENCNKYR